MHYFVIETYDGSSQSSSLLSFFLSYHLKSMPRLLQQLLFGYFCFVSLQQILNRSDNLSSCDLFLHLVSLLLFVSFRHVSRQSAW